MERMEQKKKRAKRKNRSFHLILLIVGLYVVWTFASQQIKLRELAKQEEEYKEKVAQLKLEAARLEEEVQLSNTPAFVEKVAREQLKMVKPNEIIYVDMHKAKNSQ